jgi:hypothetical protein
VGWFFGQKGSFDREQLVLIGKVGPRTERTYKDIEALF